MILSIDHKDFKRSELYTIMSQSVFTNEQSIVECHVVGDQTVESITAMGEKISTQLGELKRQHKPLLVLDDLTQMGKVPPEGRQAVVSFAKGLRYDRLAMLGTNGLLRLGVNLIARASGRSKKLRYFTNRQDAVRWLVGGDTVAQ